MTKDSVNIGGTNNNFGSSTTSGSFFYNKDSANRMANTNEQYKFMPDVNALKSSYPQMDGRFQGQSEQKSKYAGSEPQGKPGMSKDRIAFMKDAHFDFCNRAKPIGNDTMTKGMFPNHGQQPRPDILQNNAYRLKTLKLDLAEKNQPTSYVTTNSLKVKWVQPSN
jgi:hypothetical protein